MCEKCVFSSITRARFSTQTWISSDSFAPAAGNLRYGRLTFAPRRSSTRRPFQGHYTIGAARGARGSSGFPDGYNREPLRSDLRRADHTLLSELWQLLKAEGEALGFPFTRRLRSIRILHLAGVRGATTEAKMCLSNGVPLWATLRAASCGGWRAATPSRCPLEACGRR